MYIAEVYVTNASLNVDQTFSYTSMVMIEKYRRITVNFAGKNTIAICVNCYEMSEGMTFKYKLKPVIDVIDDEPVLNDSQFELAKWLSDTTVSPFISCINSMLPKPLRTVRNHKDPGFIDVIRILGVPEGIRLTDKQSDVLSRLRDGMPASTARKLSSSIIRKLTDYGVIFVESTEKNYLDNDYIEHKGFDLNDQQTKAVDDFEKSSKLVSLLYGVTGSGKTEVYLKLASSVLNQNKDVLILVPEISLTPMMIQRVKERFNDVIFYHSDLNDQERYEQYCRVKRANTRIVVGTRSAVFLPFKNLGLIIVDEEHDSSYKQEITPCYNARNVAIKRAYDAKARVLLASATPSLESYSRALKGEYELLKLSERINRREPEIELFEQGREYRYSIVPKKLQSELEKTVSSGKQAMILLNRRGYSSIVRCSSCNSVLMCKDCDCALTYHKDENVLKCHQCSRIYRTTDVCPDCSSRSLVYMGYGTKKVEEEINRIFPDYKTIRMDKDSTSGKNSHSRILDAFSKHEADIMIGTQMIAKGLDFPDVTLVAILNGDSGLFHQDYNSAKTTFDLLMQASGRSGRSDSAGRVMIETSNPDHYAVRAVLLRDYDYFFRIEMNYRSMTHYPPYSHIISFVLSDPNEERLIRSTAILYSLTENCDLHSYSPLNLPKLKGLHRNRILLTDKSMTRLLEHAHAIVEKYIKEGNVSGLKVDPDPLYLE